MFIVMTLLSLCRELLAISEEKADAIVKSGLEPAQENSEAEADDTAAATDAALPRDGGCICRLVNLA